MKLLPEILGDLASEEDESFRGNRPRGSPDDGKAAIDSLRFLPKSMEVGGALDIVTTECRLPPAVGAGALDNVARKAASIGEGPFPVSPPCSDKRLT